MPTRLLRLSEAPLLLQQADFLTAARRQQLLALCDTDALDAADIPLSRDETGLSAEIPLEHDELVMALAEEVETTLELPALSCSSVRMRHYQPGQGHPAHTDTYEIDDLELVATALVCLQAPTRGGETVFTNAAGRPLMLTHRAGQLVAWHNLTAEGLPDLHSRHLATPVEMGDKVVLAFFFYANPTDLLDAARGQRAPAATRAALYEPPPETAGVVGHPLRGFGRALAVIDDGVPAETVSLLEIACDERGVTLIRVDPDQFDFFPERILRDGDLLFRPAVSMHAIRVEQHMWHPKVGTFYADSSGGPLFSNINGTQSFIQAGLSVPRTYWLATADRPLIRRMVETLGGFPVVIKALGYSHGVGVIRADSWQTLFSIVDFALAQDHKPLLTSYIDGAIHWRLVVVGDEVVSSYRNADQEGDFRTTGSDDPEDYAAAPPEAAKTLAVKACHALRVNHGGVDVLEHPSGRLYLLEANFPCYYAQSQLEAGDDIAGAMVDHLLAEAEAHAPVPTAPSAEFL